MANGFGMLKILIGTAQADALAGGAGADELYGGPGNDTLTGAGGDDWLQPGSGNDTINGGAGFDALAYDLDDSEPPITRGVVVDLASGTATDSWNGTDTLLGIEDVFGSPRADRITGNAADNVLDGGAGNDTLNGGNGEDWLQPGPGSDSVTGGGGFDFVSYEEDQSTVPVTRGVDADLARGTALDGWGGTDTLIGVERLFGSGRADRLAGDDRGNDLMGAGGNDTLAGAGGEDWLEPGPGNDLLNGGAGDDVASYEDAAGDPAATRGLNADLANGTAADPWGGTDTLVAIENLVGTPRADTLAGAGENTLLDGRAGNDRLLRGDIVYEEAPAGIFVNLGTTARSRDGTTVAARTAHDGYGGIDTLGAGVVSGYGSRFADVWFGGSGNAYVILRAGNDFLRSGPGDDWLQGGSGADTIDGGGGFDGISYEDDGYDSAGLAFRGVRVNLATGAATDGWNNADQLSGIEDVFGSTLADLITGDAEWNYIDGGAGNDTLNGGGGNDYFLGGAGDDAVNGGAGQDFFAVGGASLADYRIVHNDDGSTTVTDLNPADGDDGVDRLVSVEQLGLAVLGTPDDDILLSEGVDPILAIGSNGNDRYVLKFAADQVVERAGQGTDSVEAGISRVLEPNVENLVLTGEASIDGTGNSAANALTGNAGDNVLNGAAGADTLRGGAGSDTYYVDSTGDEVIEVAPAQLAADRDSEATGGNIDTVISQVSYTLRANVENLQLAGLAALNGTGNGLDNLMQGNGGANRLGGLAGLDIIDGGGGNDTLSGGGGNDTLGGGAGADVFQFDTAPAGGNTDTVTDFQTGVDRILLDDDAYTAFNAAQSGQLAPAQFHSAAGAQAAHDADDRIVYNLSTGALYYDADGQGGGGAIRFATLAGQPALAAADFLIGS